MPTNRYKVKVQTSSGAKTLYIHATCEGNAAEKAVSVHGALKVTKIQKVR